LHSLFIYKRVQISRSCLQINSLMFKVAVDSIHVYGFLYFLKCTFCKTFEDSSNEIMVGESPTKIVPTGGRHDYFSDYKKERKHRREQI